MRWCPLLLATLAACRPEPTVEPAEPAPVVVAPKPAPAPESAPESAPEPEPAVPQPALEPETKLIERGQSAEFAAGVSFAYVGQNHKHPAGGGPTLGMWTVHIGTGDAQRELELRTNSELHAELVHDGRLLLIETDGSKLRVTVHAEAPEPLGEEDAKEELRSRFERWGVRPAGMSGSSVSHGVLSYSVAQGDAVYADASIGLYTRQILSFDRPAARAWRPRFPKPLEKLRLAGGAKKTTSDGIEVRRLAQHHKHRAGPNKGATAIRDFRVGKDGTTRSFSWRGDELYAELKVFDRVLVFTEPDYDRYLVRVYPKSGRIGEERALDRAKKLAERLGIDSDGSALSEDAGAYTFDLRKGSRIVCRGVIGAYTGRVARFVVVDEETAAPESPIPI